MGFSPNIKDREHAKFEENQTDGGTDVRVNDKVGNAILEDIKDNTNSKTSAVSGVVTVTNTATLLFADTAPLTDRKTITIQAKGSTVYIGFDSSVTSGNSGTGMKLSSNSVISFSYTEAISIYAIKSGGGSANVWVGEDTV